MHEQSVNKIASAFGIPKDILEGRNNVSKLD